MSKPVSSLQDVAPHLSLKALIRLSTLAHVACGFSLLLFHPYLTPIAMAVSDMAPQVRPFKEKPVPTPVAIFGISSDSMLRCSVNVNSTLSQQLYGATLREVSWFILKMASSFLF